MVYGPCKKKKKGPGWTILIEFNLVEKGHKFGLLATPEHIYDRLELFSGGIFLVHVKKVPQPYKAGPYARVPLFDGLVPNDSPSSQMGLQFERQER